jgi:hypothetical protein
MAVVNFSTHDDDWFLFLDIEGKALQGKYYLIKRYLFYVIETQLKTKNIKFIIRLSPMHNKDLSYEKIEAIL